jgi:predicted protein tyrosine phosphatase
MINKFLVTDLGKAESYAFGPKNDFDIWVTAVDESDRRKVSRMKELFRRKNVKHFYQFFYDWSDEDNDAFIQKNLETMGPSEVNVNNIISFLEPFIKDDKVHNLGVNCFAGVSRSTAITIIAMVMTGITPEKAIKDTASMRPYMWPNLRILKFASKRLNIDLLTPVKEWKNKNTVNGIYIPNN